MDLVNGSGWNIGPGSSPAQTVMGRCILVTLIFSLYKLMEITMKFIKKVVWGIFPVQRAVSPR